MSMNIKPLRAEYEAFMWELLYKTIFEAREEGPPNRDIKDLQGLKHYIEHWGEQDGDHGLIALDEGNQPMGAIWVRQFVKEDEAWGYVDDQTPELNIALSPKYRNKGVGTQLLMQMLGYLKGKVPQVSLSVNANNPSVKLYERFGFEVYKEVPPAITMLKKFK